MLSKILKWVVLPVFVILVVMAITGRKTVHVETIINAPADDVWAVLIDTPAYGEWNPLFTTQGTYQQGQPMQHRLVDPKGNVLNIKTTVATLKETQEIRQQGGYWGAITFDHQWLLEPVESGTKVIQHEEYQGFYMWIWDSSWVEPSYARVNQALKKRVESSTE